MPEMDGLEATAAHSGAGTRTGGHVPVIAMTAYAMKGDRDMCLSKGMDGYVSKPIQPAELYDVLSRLVRAPQPPHPQPLSPEGRGEKERALFPEGRGEKDLPFPPSPLGGEGLGARGEGAAPESPVDLAEAMNRVAGDKNLLRSMIAMFVEQCPKEMAGLRAAIGGGDPAGMRRAAHTLKGAIGIFGRREAYAAADRIEALGKSGDLSSAAAALAALEVALGRLHPALTALAAAT